MIFWRMTGFATSSPVDSILEKENFSLEELLDEEEIIQECKSLNSRLINYLRQRTQVEQLVRYIVEEAPEDAGHKQIFKFPFLSCEIFICEVNVILNTLVEDEDLMNMLFSFLKPDHSHSTILAGYFSKVVVCLMIRKTTALMNYVQGHKEIFQQLVDLIGITSIMEVLIWLIGAQENMYTNYVDDMLWLKDIDVLEMIVDKFSSSDSPEVHANAAEVLCAIIRCAPPWFAAKICSASFVGRLFHHALGSSTPKSAVVHSLSVCISLLDPKRLVSASYNLFRSQLTHGSLVVANPETVGVMLENLGDLLKLLDVSSAAIFFPTTYGYLKPPFGKYRLKIVEFISVLLTIGSEAAERELVQRGAIKHIINMFFEYPFNNFLHHSVEKIVGSCLESKSTLLIEHILLDCDIIGKILGAEEQPLLIVDDSKPTIATRRSLPPRIGNLGHITRIANKLVDLANSNNLIKLHLQENKEWSVWHESVLLKRNAVGNVYRWACGRPNALEGHARNGDAEVFEDRDYDVGSLMNIMNQSSTNNEIEEVHISTEQHDENDTKSAEVVSPLGLSEDQDSSVNEEDPGVNDLLAHSHSPTSTSDQSTSTIVDENENLINSRVTLPVSDSKTDTEESRSLEVEEGPIRESEDDHGELLQSVDLREASDSSELPNSNPIVSSPNDLKPDEDELIVNAHANTETCNKDSDPCIDPPEESKPNNLDSPAKPSPDENTGTMLTEVVSEDEKHEDSVEKESR